MSDNPQVQLFAKRQKLYPKRVWGTYRKLKWAVMAFAFAVYYFMPFLRWDRGPHAPDQAILIDMPSRRAYFFMIEIWPQEVYYFTGILILSAIGLFFITSILGRVWCGYFCFQTIWTDIFIWIERIVQGDRVKRQKLDEAPLSFQKIWKKTLTHILWLLVSLGTGGAWVLWFNDAPTILEQVMHLDMPMSTLSWVLALTATTYVMAGFAREQVCTYMCPYARFQSAMFDNDTLIISYDDKRGEPRGKHKKGESWDGRGDCIDCTACVQVCPVGIDIRDGLQYQCISCGLCIDACNDIMDKVERPRGLIRYDTPHNQLARAEGRPQKANLLRPRSFYYLAILLIVGGLMGYSLIARKPLELHVLHDRNPVFVTLSDGTIRNGYDIKILNKTHEDAVYRLSVKGVDWALVNIQGAGDISPEKLTVFADSVGHFRVFVAAPKPEQNRIPIDFIITQSETIHDSVESIFISE